MRSQAALDDFRSRIRKYEEVYETITNRDLHYIKLIDMCERLRSAFAFLWVVALQCAGGRVNPGLLLCATCNDPNRLLLLVNRKATATI